MLFETFKPVKIVLVDDDPVNIQLCKMVFARTISSIEFKIFEDGFSAFQWISENESEIKKEDDFILLLDLNMPILDGWGFLSYFEKLDRDLRHKFKVYILTSSIDQIDIDHSRDFHSVKSFFSKPLTGKIIQSILAEKSNAG